MKQSEIAHRIRRELQARTWTQTDLANRSSISNGHLSDILNCKREITLPVIEKIASALDIPEETLLYDNYHSTELDSEYYGILLKAKCAGISPGMLEKVIDLLKEVRES